MQKLAKPAKRVEAVDFAAKLKEAGLDGLFEPEQWPSAAAVRELNHKIQGAFRVGAQIGRRPLNVLCVSGLIKCGVPKPFIFSEMKKWLPNWCVHVSLLLPS